MINACIHDMKLEAFFSQKRAVRFGTGGWAVCSSATTAKLWWKLRISTAVEKSDLWEAFPFVLLETV